MSNLRKVFGMQRRVKWTGQGMDASRKIGNKINRITNTHSNEKKGKGAVEVGRERGEGYDQEVSILIYILSNVHVSRSELML